MIVSYTLNNTDDWQLEDLECDSRQLVMNGLIAAAYINFLSCVSEDERKQRLDQWLTKLAVEGKAQFSLKEFLTNEQQLMQWRSEGLASDNLSVENAVAILQVSTRPTRMLHFLIGLPFFVSFYFYYFFLSFASFYLCIFICHLSDKRKL